MAPTMTPELRAARRRLRQLAKTWRPLTPAERQERVRVFGLPSRVSKMPGACSPSLPPTTCNTGTRLRRVDGTPCSSCYAERLRKAYPSAAKRWTQNVRALRRALTGPPAAREAWIRAGVELLRDEARRAGDPRVRWLVAGDLQSTEHLYMITAVALRTPELYHRLPTQEPRLVADATRAGWTAPPNLKLTVSLPRVDSKAPAGAPFATSNVWTPEHLEREKPDGTLCQATMTHGACGSCSACWPALGDDAKHVIYRKH